MKPSTTDRTSDSSIPGSVLFLARIAATTACLLVGASAFAQTVVNPRIVEFDPSTDHAVVLAGGQPAVTEYALELYLQGAGSPFYTMSLGKPAPQGDGKIRYDFSSNIAAWPLPGGTYESRVTAVGPTGTGRSDPSNTFQFLTCTYTLGASSGTVTSASGSSNVTITAPTGCAWTATTAATWVSLITTSGTGNGTVSFSYSANGVGASRAATITIGGQAFSLTQAAAPCSYTLSPGSFALPATASGTNTVTVTATSGCAWTATTSTSWITLGTSSGTGNGSATFTIAANPNGTSRAGSISLGGQTLSVSQAAAACGVTVNPTSVTVGAQAGTANVAITTPTGCAWTASSAASWATVGTTSGSGSATITLTFQAYTGTTPRTGSVTVGGVTVPLTQQAYPAPVAPRNLRLTTTSE